MTDPRIRFRHLQCFLSIAQHRSVGAAANALAITQPALSKTLRELEDALDTKLFERDKKGMLLTRAGEIFLEYAAASIAAMRTGVSRVKTAGQASGRHVTIGVLPTVAARVMPHAIEQFKNEAPDITVQIITGEHAQLLDLLRLGEVELVIGRLARPESMIGLSFEELYSERLVIVVRKGHPLAKLQRPKLTQITDFPCVLPHYGTLVREEIDRFLIANGTQLPRNIVEATSIAFERSYTSAVSAVWFVAHGIVALDLKQGQLVELPFDTSTMRGPVGISVRSALTPSRSAAALIRIISETVQNLPTLDHN